MFAVALVAPLLVAACGGEDEPAGPDGGGAGTRVDAGRPGEPLDAGSCDPSQCPGRRCVNDACARFSSCGALRQAAPDLATGIYTFDVPQGGADGGPSPSTFEAYCDMETAGGGWTLVGRSVAGGQAARFSWFAGTGAVQDDAAPYALDVGSVRLAFSQLLIGDYTDGKTWGAHVYRLLLPADFTTACGGTQCAVAAGAVVAGTCNPAPRGLASMLSLAGHTNGTEFFFFRDVPTFAAYGLGAGGWSLNYADCDQGGMLHQQQGMIFAQ